jgi:hypothetical protein
MKFLDLDASASEPLYRQIYTRLRNAITDGLLQAGDRLRARWRWNWGWRAARWNRPTPCW